MIWGLLIGGLFWTVARLYNYMLRVAYSGLPEVVTEMFSSIYSLIGIFMVFRLLISLVQYLIDPDKMSDKNVGGGKLIARIVVSIVLLLSLDSIIFPTMDRLQSAILDENAIGQIFNPDNTVGYGLPEGSTNKNNFTCDEPDWTVGNEFSHDLVMSFIDDKKVSKDPNNAHRKTLNCFTIDSSYNEAVGRLATNNEIILDGFMAFIGGVVAIGFMAVLVIEIVIRYMKLVLLRVISPVACVAYMNPNDKIFNQWVKMYLSTFADLFLKLMGLQAGFILAEGLISSIGLNSLEKFIVYMAAFAFAKLVPNMISKMFGIDAGAGTFKDSFNMLKKGAGLVTGAAIGGVIGGVSGMGKGASFGTVAGGLFGGMTKGAKGGLNGKLTEGAKSQRDKNVQIRAANASGSTFRGRTAAKWANTWGQKDAYEQAKIEADASASALDAAKDLEESHIFGQMRKDEDVFGIAGLEAAVAQARDNGASLKAVNYVDNNGMRATLAAGSDLAAANKAFDDAKKGGAQTYVRALKNQSSDFVDANGRVLKANANAIKRDATTNEYGDRIGVEKLATVDKKMQQVDQKNYAANIKATKDNVKLNKASAEEKMARFEADHIEAKK